MLSFLATGVDSANGDDISIHFITIIFLATVMKPLLVAMSFGDKNKCSLSVRRGEENIMKRQVKKERTGATESEMHCGVSSDTLKRLIKLCRHGVIKPSVFRTYLLLGRLSGQAQG